MSEGRILIVDDELDVRLATEEWLCANGFDARATADALAAVECIVRGAGASRDAGGGPACWRPDVVLSDLRMPGRDGLWLLDAAHGADASLPVVLLTGHGDVASAVDAMRRGAHDFLEKPYNADHLVEVLRRAVASRRLEDELALLRAARAASLAQRLMGASAPMDALRAQVAELARLDVDVLLRGETGTGKEVVARALHDLGPRAGGAFVPINCAAIPADMIESELFGHAAGAFTGATRRRIGRFAHASGGTLFLDELESMPAPMQAKVLRAIQERRVEPLGTNDSEPIDVRIVAATKVDLGALVAAGGFRSDLYYRVNTVELLLPPLRERGDDAVALFAAFVAQSARRHARASPPVDAATLATVRSRAWPGNVRELRAAAERHALGLPLDGLMAAADPAAPGTDAGDDLPARLAAFEQRLIAEALRSCGGDTLLAAQRLGIPRRTLTEKMNRLGVRRDDSSSD
ncbi:MAG: sigma-54-dependent Fis family transcriptional regulator [Burkholderiaceae bacterium]|nr:sigma-54-dependent Fis family transcriptional regulator [Burkholderiaceae bacterium]